MIRLDVGLDLVVLGVNVGSDNGGVSNVGQVLAQLLLTTIPLVVAQSHDVEVEVVHDLSDLLALVERVEESALELITGVEPEALGVLLLELGDLGLDAGIATVAALLGLLAVGTGGRELIKMGVDVVNVEEGYIVVLAYDIVIGGDQFVGDS